MSAQSPYAPWLGASVGAYRLEELLEQGAAGPVFLGRERASGATARVRVLPVSAAQTPDAAASYHAALEREAAPLAALRHPYILPLTDYGVQDGLPYLVWPHLVMRPLSARLSQSGPMDVVNVGRYLDQIATALEAAHERGILHRNLSADCVFLQLDGQTVVADMGVRRLLELLGAGDATRPFYGSLEACAPEQLTDGAVGPYTDVYALGALAYRLLTGRPIFTGENLDALLQRHLHGLIPSVRERRPGLPGALDPVFARALAKEPAARFASPGAFADAYHAVISPGRGNRVPFSARTAAARRNPRSRITGGAPSGDGPSGGGSSDDAPSGWASSPSSLHGEDAVHGNGAPSQPYDGAPSARVVALNAPAAPRGRLAALASKRSSIIATALLLLLFASGGVFILAGGNLLPGAGPSASGQVDFVDSPRGPAGHTDALQLSAKGLPAPPTGSHYSAWILDQQTEHVVPLGVVSGTNQTSSLAYDGDAAHGQPGTNLLGLGNKIEVTLEHGDGSLPVGAVVLIGTFPPKATVHIQHLLVSFPTTPGKIGLLVGILMQTQLLSAQATLLQNAQASRNLSAVQCSAQSVVDIIEGARGPNYRSLGPSCLAQDVAQSGDGYGLLAPAGATLPAGTDTLGYLDGVSDHASLAATQPDATATIRTHAGHVEIAIANIRGWVTAADKDALTLLTTPNDTATAADLATLSDHAYHGVPSSADQQINPVLGQAGAITAYEHGQFMATLTLAPGH